MKNVLPLSPGGVSAASRQGLFDPTSILEAANRFRDRVAVVCRARDRALGVVFGCETPADVEDLRSAAISPVGLLPALFPEWLGDRAFTEVHGCRFPYVVGEMARGIASTDMVIAAARGGLLGFFGSAGLTPAEVAEAIDRIRHAIGATGLPWGMNLIHSVHDVALEDALVDLFLEAGVARVSASAFMALTPAVVRYACRGLTRAPDGRVHRRHHLFAKVSRPEVARPFMSPAPAGMLRELVSAGRLSAAEADLAVGLPLAGDVTVEADSGGHTDNRPLAALFPVIAALRDELTAQFRYDRTIRVGAAGGLGTPAAVAAAFALGASYVLTGSVNQAAVESGLSEAGRRMLAEAGVADVIMAPAADMFELGIKVQVLKRGTLFHARANRLYELYRSCDGIDAIQPADRLKLEAEVFGAPLEEIWERTRQFFERRDPAEVARAERDPRHRMALVFRWYLFHGSKWAMDGTAQRRMDYQIWCGPAMGAFNDWVKGSFLEGLERRDVVQIARNLLEGAAVVTRASQMRTFGLAVPAAAFHFRPRPLK